MTELIDVLFGTVTKTSLLIIIHLDLSLSVSNLVSVSLTKMISDRSGPGFVCLWSWQIQKKWLLHSIFEFSKKKSERETDYWKTDSFVDRARTGWGAKLVTLHIRQKIKCDEFNLCSHFWPFIQSNHIHVMEESPKTLGCPDMPKVFLK